MHDPRGFPPEVHDVILVGTEGMAQLEASGVDWARPATEEEVALHRQRIEASTGAGTWQRLLRDNTGRLYSPVSILRSAPVEVRGHVNRYFRVKHLWQ